MNFWMGQNNHTKMTAQCRRGLNNTGNNCYMNSIVQALMCDNDLIQLLQERLMGNRTSSMSASKWLVAMSDKRYQLEQIPLAFRNLMAAQNPQFGTKTQQDAQEFLTVCLEVLEGEYSGNEKKNKTDTRTSIESLSSRLEGLTISDSESDSDKPTIDGIRRALTQRQSLGYSLIQERVFQCMTCDLRSNPVEERLVGLSLSIPMQHSWVTGRLRYVRSNLQTLIGQVFKPERIDRRCPHCGCEKAVVETRISSPPRCLVVNVKRFSNDLQKIATPVAVPQEVLLPTGNFRHSASRDKVYQLKAVVRHRSKSITGGHYVADILEDDGTWTCCDDSRVLTLNETGAQKTEGYIFFYGS